MPENRLVPLRPEPATRTSERVRIGAHPRRAQRGSGGAATRRSRAARVAALACGTWPSPPRPPMGPLRAPRAGADRRAAAAARALPADAEGGVYQRAVDAGGARGAPARSLRPLAAARGLARADRARHEPVARRAAVDPLRGRGARAAAGQEGWLRFSLVRDPAPRLWSGWQSKLLLREPRFVEDFGDAPWFPRVPWAAARDRRRLPRVRRRARRGRGRGRPLGGPARPGRAAPAQPRRPRRAARRDARAARGARRRPARWRAGTRTAAPCRCRRAPTTRHAAAVLRERHGADYAAFGYEPPSGDAEPLAAWEAEVEPLLPLLRATIDEHTRLGQLHRIAQQRRGRVQSAEQRLESVSKARQGGRRALARDHQPRGPHRLQRPLGVGRGRRRGTASPRWCGCATRRAPPVGAAAAAAAVVRVLLLDNGSADGSADVARRVAPRRARRSGSTSATTRSRSRAAATSTSARRPTPCTASPTSTTGRSRTSAPPTRSSGTATWSSPTPPSARCATSPGSSRRRADRQGAALPALRGRRPARVHRHRAAQLRAVGLAQRARLQLRQGDRLGAAAVGRPTRRR